MVEMEEVLVALLAVTVRILFLAPLHQLAVAVEVNLLIQVVKMEVLAVVALDQLMLVQILVAQETLHQHHHLKVAMAVLEVTVVELIQLVVGVVVLEQ
jgi:hypothetical protein